MEKVQREKRSSYQAHVLESVYCFGGFAPRASGFTGLGLGGPAGTTQHVSMSDPWHGHPAGE